MVRSCALDARLESRFMRSSVERDGCGAGGSLRVEVEEAKPSVGVVRRSGELGGGVEDPFVGVLAERSEGLEARFPRGLVKGKRAGLSVCVLGVEETRVRGGVLTNDEWLREIESLIFWTERAILAVLLGVESKRFDELLDDTRLGRGMREGCGVKNTCTGRTWRSS
ncbi:hypothetical protein BC938DRAFT_481670 [Jimgerdemannia flammicorona]|uniref:Uncharacterized protein n=1 Tax=Jimgerdemannia flammicorona TaxID=994334 RepID=A0A433QWP7_9FUNG|nr:hypothetical protein BC938DRAFT_481670 [Jimgerdemannia flammicorona]